MIQGGIAAAALLVGSEKSFDTIQSAVIMPGLPFCIVMLLIIHSIFKGLRDLKKENK